MSSTRDITAIDARPISAVLGEIAVAAYVAAMIVMLFLI
jgi:hypothetical protein